MLAVALVELDVGKLKVAHSIYGHGLRLSANRAIENSKGRLAVGSYPYADQLFTIQHFHTFLQNKYPIYH